MLFLLLACNAQKPTDSAPAILCDTPGLTPGARAERPMDDTLHMGMLQARGTHNSYHRPTEPVLDASWAYTQPALTAQLADLGVRQVELDLHRRDDGGWDVFHIPVVDAGSTCLSFTDCLREICSFSVRRPDHAPIIVWMEPKDDLDDAAEGWKPIVGEEAWSDLEQTIRAAIPADHLYVPDGWRRGAATLADASADLGPPALSAVRGRVLFALLDSGAHRDDYLSKAPDLQGRLLFPDSWIGDPWAALVKDAGASDIAALHAAGLVVTDNVDGAANSDADNTATRDTALAAGVNYAASDFPAPADGYWMDLPDADPVRCNPVTAPADCAPGWME